MQMASCKCDQRKDNRAALIHSRNKNLALVQVVETRNYMSVFYVLYQCRAVPTALWQRELTIRVAARLIKESPVAGTEILDQRKIC